MPIDAKTDRTQEIALPAFIQSLGFRPDLACGEARVELAVVELSKLAELLDQRP